MKRERWLSLLLALLLTGCAQSGGETAAAPPEKLPEAETTAVDTTGELTAARTESDARALTEEEVLSAYDRAVRAYGWFVLDTLPTGAAAELEDGTYRKVNYPGISDTGDLRSYLRSLFSQEIVDVLMDGGPGFSHYIDVDGALHVRYGGRDKDLHVGQIRTQVERTGDTSYSVNVTAELLGEDLTTVTGMELGAFPYEYREGRWVFTQFRLMN